MNNSEISSKRQSKILKWLIIFTVLISFIGFLDSVYLTAKHFSGTQLGCSIFDGCNEVTSSEYSTFFGIPLALMGVGYYLGMLILSILYLDTKKLKLLLIIPFFSIVGLLASAYFVYLQLFVIKALCEYCMLSALTSTILFILGIIIYTRFFRRG